jgi:hypothetical protein
MENEEPLLDMEVIEETAEFGIDDLRDLIDVYMVQATETMRQIKIMIEVGQLKEVSLLSHRLAGSSAACGATGVMQTLRSMELNARDDRLQDCVALFDRAILQIERSEAELGDYLAKKGYPLHGSFVPPERPQHSTS